MNVPVEATFEEPILLARLSAANHIYCSFEPLAELVGGKWVEIDVDDRGTRFPRSGIRGKPSELGQGRQLGGFWVLSGDTLRTSPGTATVSRPTRAIPLIDLSAISLGEARKCLVETGVALPEHQERMAVVLLEGGLYAYLKFGTTSRRPHLWTARLTEGKVELRSAVDAWGAGAEISSGKYLPISGEPTGQVVRTEDWSTETDFLTRVAAALAGAARGLGPLMERGSEWSAKRVEKAILDSRLDSTGAHEWASMIERLRSEWQTISRSAEAVRSIGSLVLDSAEGRMLLEVAIERRLDGLSKNLESKVQLEVADRLASKNAELERLQASVATLSDQERSLNERVRAGTREVEAATRAVEAKTAEVERARRAAEAAARSAAERRSEIEVALTTLREMEEAHAREAAHVEAIRGEIAKFGERIDTEFELLGSDESGRLEALAGRLRVASGSDRSGPVFPPSSPPWWGESLIDTTKISVGELAGRLTVEAEAHGIVPEDLLLLDAFARAGELVVLTGEISELALEAYSRAVGGGAVRAVSVDPGVIGVDDLWRNPATARPTALAWAWHRADAAPDSTFVVCLRGLDMSPARAWIPAFEAALHSRHRPSNLLVLATTTENGDRAEAGDPSDRDERNSWLRRHAVGLRIRAGQDGGFATAILGSVLPPAATLVPGKTEHELSFSAIRGLAAGHTPHVTRRAIRFLRALSVAQAPDAVSLATRWAKLVREGSVDGLPPAMAGGHEDLMAARFLD